MKKLICIKQRLSNIWSSIHEKVKVAMKLCSMHYLYVVIILFNTGF